MEHTPIEGVLASTFFGDTRHARFSPHTLFPHETRHTRNIQGTSDTRKVLHQDVSIWQASETSRQTTQIQLEKFSKSTVNISEQRLYGISLIPMPKIADTSF